MARYFKYRSVQDVREDAQRLGHEIPMDGNLDALFAPLEVGGQKIGNRLAIHPMEGCDGTLDGLPDELTIRRYQRFGSGGAAFIWGEATAISDAGRMNPRQLWIHDGSMKALEQMLTECRKAQQSGAFPSQTMLLGLQLTHSGRYSYRRPMIVTRDPTFDPVTIDKRTGRPIPADYPVLSDDELCLIEDQYVEAAHRAARIGCDFVDIKQCHRYLLSELLAARNRDGKYGGTLENRTRLVRNVVTRIRSELPELMIVSRLNVYDGIPYQGTGEEFVGTPVPHDLPLVCNFGTDPQDHRKYSPSEPVQVARWLRDWGVSLLSISAGNPYANPHVVRPAEFPPVDGYHAPEHPLLGVLRHFELARTIQESVPDIPVMGSGYSWLQDYAMHAAAANVRNGDVQMVGLGRAALSHPDFARELAEHGRLERKKVCRTFSYCTNLMRSKDHPLGQYPTGCPPFDKEVYGPLWKEAEEKLAQRDS